MAAEDPRIAAVVSQAPYTDSLPVIRRMPLGNLVRATLEAVRDQVGAGLGRAPTMIAAVGAPGTFAAMTEPDVVSGFAAIVGPDSLWRNEFAARLMLALPFYRPVRVAPRLAMPVLFCVCDDDTTTPPSSTIAAAGKSPRGELIRYPFGHFAIYNDPQVKADQVAFLRRVLDAPDPLSPNATDQPS
mgnify:CR=1 FL=1